MLEIAWIITRACILLAPFAFISEQPFLLPAYDGLCLFAGVAVLLSGQSKAHSTVLISLIPFLLWGALVASQLVPLPTSWLQVISPAAADLYAETIWLIFPDIWLPITVHSQETIKSLIHVLSMGGIAVALGYFMVTKRTLLIAQTLCSALCLWSVTSLLCSAGMILFKRGEAFGIQLQPAEIALQSFAIALMPISFAVSSTLWPRNENISLQQQLHNYLIAPTAYPHLSASFAACLVVISSLCSQSPWLLLAGVGGYIFYRMFRVQTRRQKRFYLSVALICFVTMSFVAHAKHWNGAMLDIFFPVNLSAWSPPWLGFGLGADGDFYNIMTASAGRRGGPALASLLLGLGWGGILWLFMSVWGHVRVTRSIMTKTNDRFFKELSRGGAVCCVVFFLLDVTCHQISWELLTTGVVIASVFAIWSVRHIVEGTQRSRFSSRIWIKGSAVALLTLVLFVNGLYAIGNSLAESYIVSFDTKLYRIDQHTSVDEGIQDIRHAAIWSPFNDQVQKTLGYASFSQKRDLDAREHFLAAMKLRPLAADTILSVAIVDECLGDRQIAKQFMSAESLAAFRPGLADERMLVRLLDCPKSTGVTDIMSLFIEHAPEQAGHYIALMLSNGWPLKEILQVIPENPSALTAFGDFALSQGDLELTEHAYLRATSLSEYRQVDPFLHTADFYMKVNRYESALLIARIGSEYFPNNSDLRIFIAKAHEHLGQGSIAQKEYRRAAKLKNRKHGDSHESY